MTQYSKFNLIYRLQKWLDSVPGQTFMNYAYSWGASIVIAGALFKLTHLPGANFMLFLGMGTEVLVFFISGFDRPFDKTEDGKELPTHVNKDEEAVPSDTEEAPEEDTMASGSETGGGATIVGGGIIGGPVIGGGTVVGGDGTIVGSPVVGGGGIIGGGGTVIIGGGSAASGTVEAGETPEGTTIEAPAGAIEGTPFGGPIIGGVAMPELPDINAEDMEEATNNYVEQLKNLTETLKKVSEQSERLTRDSEEMENLNRTLTGICKVYEMQLKGASQQVGTIDQINEQTRRMADQIAELNQIYTRMIEAMTVNMPPRPLNQGTTGV